MRIKRNASSRSVVDDCAKSNYWNGSGGKHGINQYLALPNKFFDYISCGPATDCYELPEYIDLNRQFEVAVLIDDINPGRIADTVNNLLQDDVVYQRLRDNCLKAGRC